jgi:hypothetical protein
MLSPTFSKTSTFLGVRSRMVVAHDQLGWVQIINRQVRVNRMIDPFG